MSLNKNTFTPNEQHKKLIAQTGALIQMPIEEEILLKIADIADSKGIMIYAVGGFVRDYFLERERSDFDITVIGDSIEFAKHLASVFKSKAVVYERFKTALVPINGFNIEFVGTRKEVYSSNSRKPTVTQGSLEDDLKRRDFTINAMAVCLNKEFRGEIIDIFGGIVDLNKRLLKTPLEPKTTYSDDPLRMMRAARFASQLDFFIDDDSFSAINEMADRISIISQERITDEFLKIIDSDKPSVGLSILFKTGLLKLIFPELYDMQGVDKVEKNGKIYGHKDVFWHSLKVLDNAATRTNDTWLRFAALCHDIAKPRTKRFIDGIGWSFHGHEEIGARWMRRIFKRMKFPLEHLAYVEKLIRLHGRPMVLVEDEVTDSAIRRLAVHAGADIEDLFTLVRADITTKNPDLESKYHNNYELVFEKVLEVQEKDKLREFQSPVRGEEIMEITGLKPCKAVGIIKTNIEEAILEGEIANEYDATKEYFTTHLESWISEIEDKFKIFH